MTLPVTYTRPSAAATIPNASVNVPPTAGNDWRCRRSEFGREPRHAARVPYKVTQTVPAPSTVMPSGEPTAPIVVSGAPSAERDSSPDRDRSPS